MPTDESRPDSSPELTGDVAAQAATSDLSPPKRRRPVSRKPKADTAASMVEAPVEESPPRVGAEATVAAKPRRTPRRPAKRAITPLESNPADSVDPQPATPLVEPPARKPRRSARPKVTEQQSTVSPTVSEELPAASTEEKPAQQRPPRRRRTAKSIAVEEQVASAIGETAAPTEPPASAEVDTPKEERRSRRSRSRRSGRRGRPTEAEPLQEVVAEAPLPLGACVVMRDGRPRLSLDQKIISPMLFFGNLETEKSAHTVEREARFAASSGIHLHSVLIELPCPLPPEDAILDGFDQRILTLLNADPRGSIVPRVVFTPLSAWREQYPNECIVDISGTTEEPSLASEKFWAEAENSLRLLIEHFQHSPYHARIAGYHLERGEWFNLASAGIDRSYANRESFREWLRTKYRNSESSLRAAWFDNEVQFFTANIPGPVTHRAGQAFFHPYRERRWIDFYEYSSDLVASRIGRLAAVVKSETRGSALVSACYGYAFDFGHLFSGHLALGKLSSDPNIDLICGPPSYSDRLLGGSGAFPALADSLALHDKLWLSEDDTKTYLSPTNSDPDDYNPRMPDEAATFHARRRAIGAAIATGAAVGWMDLWGEGWLDSSDQWRQIEELKQIADLAYSEPGPSDPEVVVLIDERSLLHIQRGPDSMKEFLHGHREAFLRSGASVGFYLQSDLLADRFPTNAKLYVFLCPYRLPSEEREAITSKLHRDGKTLVWVYAVGCASASGEPDETAHEITGFTLRQQSWDSEAGTRISNRQHAITQSLTSNDIGQKDRINPTFFAEDLDRSCTVLGEYQQSGLPSIVARNCGAWNTVFVGEPELSRELIRGLCRHAGVHLYRADGDDVVYARNGWVTLHTATGGERTLSYPGGTFVYDLNNRRTIAADGGTLQVYMEAGTTANLLVAPRERLESLGVSVEMPPVVGEAEAIEETRPRRGRRTRKTTPQPPAPSALVYLTGEPLSEPPLEAEATANDEEAAPAAEEPAPKRGRRRGGKTKPAPTLAEAKENEVTPASELIAPSASDNEVDDDEAEDEADDEGNSEEDDPDNPGEDDDNSAAARRRRRRRGGRGRGRRRHGGSPHASGS